MDSYTLLGKELRLLFKDLENPDDPLKIQRQMDQILRLADQIGGPLKKEAFRLKQDVSKYLDAPEDEKLKSVVKEHALRLEQETREI